MKYYVGGSLFHPPIELEIPDGPPPCLYCGRAVHSPSMGGPLVCAACDCGSNQDGSQKSSMDYKRGAEHCAALIARYRTS